MNSTEMIFTVKDFLLLFFWARLAAYLSAKVVKLNLLPKQDLNSSLLRDTSILIRFI